MENVETSIQSIVLKNIQEKRKAQQRRQFYAAAKMISNAFDDVFVNVVLIGKVIETFDSEDQRNVLEALKMKKEFFNNLSSYLDNSDKASSTVLMKTMQEICTTLIEPHLNELIVNS